MVFLVNIIHPENQNDIIYNYNENRYDYVDYNETDYLESVIKPFNTEESACEFAYNYSKNLLLKCNLKPILLKDEFLSEYFKDDELNIKPYYLHSQEVSDFYCVLKEKYLNWFYYVEVEEYPELNLEF